MALQRMKRQSGLVREVVRRIVRKMKPAKVILFGSRARGEAREESDYDFFVVAESGEPRHRRSAPLYTLLADLPAEVEIAVYTPGEVAEWEGVRESFVGRVLAEGKVVYEAKA
ncbi:MAG: nucleotidyltransferase domain-containing protein [Planctomycetota bacterium]